MPVTEDRDSLGLASDLVEGFAFQTDLGWMAIAVRDDRLEYILFGQPTFSSLQRQTKARGIELVDDPGELGSWVDELCERLSRFAEGTPEDFTDIRVFTDHLTPFARRVVKACRQLAWGETASYADIAKRAGRVGAARAVGNVMANNRCALVVPCHRVVGSGGALGGYSAPGGLATKRRLLDMEAAV